MQDRLLVWLLVAVAFVAIVTLSLVGLHPFAVLGLVHVPAVLLTMLALRATVCLVRRQPTALRIGSRRILGGWWSLLVPLLLLTLWTVGRETGAIRARLSATSTDDRTNTSWSTTFNEVGPGLVGGDVPVPAAFEHAAQFEIGGDNGAMHDAFAAALQPIGGLLPGIRIVGRIGLEAQPPLAVMPLWKSTPVAGHVACELYLCQADSGTCRATLKGSVDVEGNCTMWGFASQRDLHEYLGARLGETTREPLVEQLQQLAEKLR